LWRQIIRKTALATGIVLPAAPDAVCDKVEVARVRKDLTQADAQQVEVVVEDKSGAATRMHYSVAQAENMLAALRNGLDEAMQQRLENGPALVALPLSPQVFAATNWTSALSKDLSVAFLRCESGPGKTLDLLFDAHHLEQLELSVKLMRDEIQKRLHGFCTKH
jgi:hypothetical protein